MSVVTVQLNGDTYVLDVAQRAVVVDDSLTIFWRDRGSHSLVLVVCELLVEAVCAILLFTVERLYLLKRRW